MTLSKMRIATLTAALLAGTAGFAYAQSGSSSMGAGGSGGGAGSAQTLGNGTPSGGGSRHGGGGSSTMGAGGTGDASGSAGEMKKGDEGRSSTMKNESGMKNETGRSAAGEHEGRPGRSTAGEHEGGKTRAQTHEGKSGTSGANSERGERSEKGARGSRSHEETTGRSDRHGAGDSERQGTSGRNAGDTERQGTSTRRTETTGATEAGGRVNLTTEQKTEIKRTVVESRSAPRVTNVDFDIHVGTVVPARVHFAEVPETIVHIHPAWRGYRYFVYNDEVIIIEPKTRKIVEVIVVS